MKFTSLKEFETYQENNDIAKLDIDLSNCNITKLNKPIKCQSLNLSFNQLSTIDVEIDCNTLDLSNNKITRLGKFNLNNYEQIMAKILSQDCLLETNLLNKIICRELFLTNNDLETNAYMIFYHDLFDYIYKISYDYWFTILVGFLILFIKYVCPYVIALNVIFYLGFNFYNIFINCIITTIYLYFFSLYYGYYRVINIVKIYIKLNPKNFKYNINIPNIQYLYIDKQIINSEYFFNRYVFVQKYKVVNEDCMICFEKIEEKTQFLCCNNQYKLHCVCYKCFRNLSNACLMCYGNTEKYYNEDFTDDTSSQWSTVHEENVV
jgi:hypothetical protein